MHAPRSPHTPHCGFSFVPHPTSPVPLMPGQPRPLTSSPHHPVPHIPGPSVSHHASLFQRNIKQEEPTCKLYFFLLYEIIFSSEFFEFNAVKQIIKKLVNLLSMEMIKYFTLIY